jgi:hypothetical protein
MASRKDWPFACWEVTPFPSRPVEHSLLSGLIEQRPGCPNVMQCGRLPEGRMSQAERFANLLREFERVGVDPNTISAGLAVRQDDVLRALSALPDGAGPAAFLSQLRVVMTHPVGADEDNTHNTHGSHGRDSA